MNLPPVHSVKEGWPRGRVIAQWHKVLNDPTNSRYPMVIQIATEALQILRADKEREPGADDEVMA